MARRHLLRKRTVTRTDLVPASLVVGVLAKIQNEETRRDTPEWYVLNRAMRAVWRLADEAKARAAHQHRFITDEDGAVWPCACGQPYAPPAAGGREHKP